MFYMKYRRAKSLDTLVEQVNQAHPKRSKKSDGWIGDAKHASRSSDHNPWVKDGATGVVTAMDITDDPANGCDARKLAELLIASRDPRIKYIISEGQICSSKQQPWKWRKYTGANGHFHHVHISVDASKSLYDSTKPWAIHGTVDIAEPEQLEEARSFYKVVAGDSLWNLAVTFKTTVADLKKLNGLATDLIKPGQALRIK